MSDTHSKLHIHKHTHWHTRGRQTLFESCLNWLQSFVTKWVRHCGCMGSKTNTSRNKAPQTHEPAPIIHLKEPACFRTNRSNMWSKYCVVEGSVALDATACHKGFLFDSGLILQCIFSQTTDMTTRHSRFIIQCEDQTNNSPRISRFTSHKLNTAKC